MAAHRQGKFWEYHDKIFANMRQLKKPSLIKYAKDIGLDVAKFKKDLADPALAQTDSAAEMACPTMCCR